MFWHLFLAGFVYILFRLAQQASFWRLRQVPSANVPLAVGLVMSIFRPTQSLTEMVKALYIAYPKSKYFGYLDFMGPALMIRDPELVREIGVKAFDCFPNHQSALSSSANDSLLNSNLLSLQGQRWKDMRNMLTPSFTAAKMRQMFSLIDDCARDFVQYLKIGEEFDAKDAFARYTCDVIATAAFGLEVNSMKNPDNEFYRAGMETSNFSLARVYVALILSKIPILGRNVDSGIVSTRTRKFFTDLIEQTVRTRKEQGIVRPDMIQLMMEAAEKEGGFQVTMSDMVAQAFVFFLGGFDTSSGFMCSVMYELAGNPEVQEKLRREIEEFIEDEKVTYEDLGKLKYLDQVLSESLRFYPQAVMTDRTCVKEFQLPSPMEGYPGYNFEPGVMCHLNIIGMHFDPQYFPDPEKFDPDRFSEERKHEINPYTYLPFGLGPRRCIGDRFALMETKILIVHLMRNYEIGLARKTKYPIVYDKTRVAPTPQGGFHLKLERRKKFE